MPYVSPETTSSKGGERPSPLGCPLFGFLHMSAVRPGIPLFVQAVAFRLPTKVLALAFVEDFFSGSLTDGKRGLASGVSGLACILTAAFVLFLAILGDVTAASRRVIGIYSDVPITARRLDIAPPIGLFVRVGRSQAVEGLNYGRRQIDGEVRWSVVPPPKGIRRLLGPGGSRKTGRSVDTIL